MRKKKHSSNEVQLNLAAMLDMAFQLLAFFILTFKPAAVEVELRMNLPLQQGVASYKETKTETPQNARPPDGVVAIYEAIPVHVDAEGDGKISGIKLGQRSIVTGQANDASLALLGQELGKLISQPNAVDRVEIVMSSKLNYSEFIRVMETCTKQKLANGKPLSNINFKVK